MSAAVAQRREQLENHLKKFREIAEQRQQEKINRWARDIPAAVSTAILLCQIANTIIFGSFAYNFNRLYIMIEEYVRETDKMNLTLPNSTTIYSYGQYEEKLVELDKYRDQLWNLFVAEIIELIFPAINICLFAWIISEKNRRLPSKIQVIYLLCPGLALVLSITQALTIHVSITESIYTIRFFLAKILNVLVDINKKGRLPIEAYFECEFFNDDDIVKPPCAGQIHDTVLSKSTLTVVMMIHVVPIVVFVYMLIRNLASNKSEQLFLYIETVDASRTTPYEYGKPSGKNGGAKLEDEKCKGKQLKDTINDLLIGFNTKFVPKKTFHENLNKHGKKSIDLSKFGIGSGCHNSQQLNDSNGNTNQPSKNAQKSVTECSQV